MVEDITANTSQITDKLIAIATTWGMKIVGVLFVLAIAFIVAGFAKSWTRRALERTPMDLTLSKFFANVVKYSIIIFTLLGCMGVFGIQTTSFAAVIGAAGLAIGLALQGTLSSLAAGMMLLFSRPFKVGDYVEVGGQAGTVDEIGLFTTNLNTIDNKRVFVPNSGIFGTTIVNYTSALTRRVSVDIGVDYGADMDDTRKALEKAIARTDKVLSEPASAVVLVDMGASAVNWQLRAWVYTPDFWAVKQQLTYQTKVALDEASISIPFPQLDVRLCKVK